MKQNEFKGNFKYNIIAVEKIPFAQVKTKNN